MVNTTRFLILRNLRIKRAAYYFSKNGPVTVADLLLTTINEGTQILRILNEMYSPNQCLVNSLSGDLLDRIENYHLDSLCAIEMAGVMKQSELCETEEILLDMKDEGSFLLMYLGRDINSQQLVKK